MRYPLALSVVLASLAFAHSSGGLAASRTPVPEAARLELERGNDELALKMLAKHRKQRPEDAEGYAMAARALLYRGEVEEAKALLAAGIERASKPNELHYLLGIQLLTEGRDGPGVVRSSGSVAHQPTGDADEEAFRRDRFSAAKAHLQEAVRSPGFDLEAAPALIFAHGELGEFEAGLAVAEEFMTPECLDGQILCGAMRCLIELDRAAEAVELARSRLGSFGRDPAVWHMLSRAHQGLGQDDEAAACVARAKFYGWAPEFVGLDYSPQKLETLQRLFGETEDAEESNGLFGPAMDFEAIEVTIEELAGSGDPDANKMLAALCYSHRAHGHLEERAFEELAKDQAEDLLLAIYNHAGSRCTIGGSLRALALMKSEKSFPLLAKHLPHDSGFFSMRIADSMVVLGDERAVPYLVKRLEAALEPVRGRRDRDIGKALMSFINEGPLFVALARFGTPEAEKAIRKQLDSEDNRFIAQAALYCITGDEACLVELERLAESGRIDHPYHAQELLADRAEDARCAKLVSRIEAFLEREEEERRAG